MSFWINILNNKDKNKREEKRVPLYAPIYNDPPYNNNDEKQNDKSNNKEEFDIINDFEINFDIDRDSDVTKIRATALYAF